MRVHTLEDSCVRERSLVCASPKRHNFKYTGRLLIKFGHNNIGLRNAVSFIRKSVSLDVIPPLELIKHILPLPKKFVDRKKLFNPF